eukprot:242530-Chlamydomonas_euryale.AAC.1
MGYRGRKDRAEDGDRGTAAQPDDCTAPERRAPGQRVTLPLHRECEGCKGGAGGHACLVGGLGHGADLVRCAAKPK